MTIRMGITSIVSKLLKENNLFTLILAVERIIDSCKFYTWIRLRFLIGDFLILNFKIS